MTKCILDTHTHTHTCLIRNNEVGITLHHTILSIKIRVILYLQLNIAFLNKPPRYCILANWKHNSFINVYDVKRRKKGDAFCDCTCWGRKKSTEMTKTVNLS